jgi:hypothetical protein
MTITFKLLRPLSYIKLDMTLSTSYFKLSLLVIAISLALISPTFAVDFTIADGETETAPQTLLGTTDDNTGVIEVGEY